MEKYFIKKEMNKEIELDRLLKLEKKWTHMFDSDYRVAMALLDEIRILNRNQNKDEILTLNSSRRKAGKSGIYSPTDKWYKMINFVGYSEKLKQSD